MRILVAHLVSSERSGGMSRLMGRAHDELERAGHDVTYLSADDVGAAARGRGGRLIFPWSVRAAVLDAVRQGRPYDVVNVHEPHGAPVAAFRGGQNGTAVVAMTHGVEQRGWEVSLERSETRPSLKTRCVYPISSLWQSRMALQRADHVICLNTQDRDFLQGRFGVDGSRITRVTPGADAIFGEGASRRDYAPPTRLLFAGTWLPRKGTRVLANAFERLCAEGLPLQLDVLGAGVPAERVRADFAPGVRDRVQLVTARGDREIASAMASAGIFVLPSLFEGTPLTLIEAMWSGLPIVTTATAGMRDVIRHETDGLLVSPGDPAMLAQAIGRLTRDAELRQKLGRAAHATAVAQYTWQRTAETFEGAYRAALNRGRQRG
jgi:glycosyltransferase involved in cell wall biosynthesis